MSTTNDEAMSVELCGIDCGDERLNKRSQRLVTSLAIDPQLSINAYEHVPLAVTPEGLPLGVAGTESHDREPASLGHTHATHP